MGQNSLADIGTKKPGRSLLPYHIGYFKPVVDGIYVISMFIKKQVNVQSEREHIINANPTYSGRGLIHSRILQWLKLLNRKKYIEDLNETKISCGDFNLKTETESLKIISHGMHTYR